MNNEIYGYLLQAHNLVRWIILLLLVLLIFRSIAASRPFTNGDRTMGTILTIFADIMLIVGFYQWYAGDWGLKRIQEMGMGEAMKNATVRFFAVEHLTLMLLGIIFIHIAGSYARKPMPDPRKHRKRLLFYTLALLVIVIAIPWPFRDPEIARPWIRY